jgi:alkylhydroperoxidase family enzyme
MGSTARAAALLDALQPEAWNALLAVVDHAWTMADADLLALCVTRVAQLSGTDTIVAELVPPARSPRDAEARHGVREWFSSNRHTTLERACLAFVEQLHVDPDAMTDRDVELLREHMTSAEVLGFASAVYVLDARVRVLAVMAQAADRGPAS